MSGGSDGVEEWAPADSRLLETPIPRALPATNDKVHLIHSHGPPAPYHFRLPYSSDSE
jgi:hypothetical protein